MNKTIKRKTTIKRKPQIRGKIGNIGNIMRSIRNMLSKKINEFQHIPYIEENRMRYINVI
jgi:hypothetical protein